MAKHSFRNFMAITPFIKGTGPDELFDVEYSCPCFWRGVAMRPFAYAFYHSKAWRKTRDAYFVSQHGLCERCGSGGVIVHHKIMLTPDNIGDPNVTLNWENLELVCVRCHSEEHGEYIEECRRVSRQVQATQAGLAFDEDGNLVKDSSAPSPPYLTPRLAAEDRRGQAFPFPPRVGPHEGGFQEVSQVDSSDQNQPENPRLYAPEVKVRKIKREIRRLRKLLAEIPDGKLKAAEGLIQEAAFMRLTLEETRHIIDREGVLEDFAQGAQRFTREHPATKVYNTMINRYVTVCRALADLVPGTPAGGGGNGSPDRLAAFLQRGPRPPQQ